MEKVQAAIMRVLSHNEANGWSLLVLKCSKPSKKSGSSLNRGFVFKAFGNIHSPKPGGVIEVEGDFEVHEKYGAQFKAKTMHSTKIVRDNHIFSALNTDLFPEVDSQFAKRLKEVFANDLVYWLENKPQELLSTKELNQDQLFALYRRWVTARTQYQEFNFLRNVGFSERKALGLMDVAGDNSKNLVTNDPYSLVNIPGFNFRDADMAADRLGLRGVGSKRAYWGVKSIFDGLISRGNTRVTYGLMVSQIKKVLSVEYKEAETLINSHIRKLYGIERNNKNQTVLFDFKLANSEKSIASDMKRLLLAKPKFDLSDITPEEDFLNEGQSLAIACTLKTKVSIVTGGPGVGKTTTLVSLLKCIDKGTSGTEKIMLAAPTGKAAQRMTEATGLKGGTVHELLGYNPKKGYKYNELNKLDVDTLIVDEWSMGGVDLTERLLSALPDHVRLVILGDRDQLLSVSPGQVLNDFIHSNVIPVYELTEFMRFGGTLEVNARRINSGLMPELSDQPEDPYYFIQANSDIEIKQKIEEYLKESYSTEDQNSLKDIQILTPQIKTESGVWSLNRATQPLFNPEGKRGQTLKVMGTTYSVGDRVIQTENDKELEINNGDVGVIQSIPLGKETVSINFDGLDRVIPKDKMGNVSLAYGMTIHKSQGSEYPTIIIPVSDSHKAMWSRRILFTAVTRAKAKVVLVGQKDVIQLAIANTREYSRNTGLVERLREVLPRLTNEIGREPDRSKDKSL